MAAAVVGTCEKLGLDMQPVPATSSTLIAIVRVFWEAERRVLHPAFGAGAALTS